MVRLFVMSLGGFTSCIFKRSDASRPRCDKMRKGIHLRFVVLDSLHPSTRLVRLDAIYWKTSVPTSHQLLATLMGWVGKRQGDVKEHLDMLLALPYCITSTGRGKRRTQSVA